MPAFPPALPQQSPLPSSDEASALLESLRDAANPAFHNWATTFQCQPNATFRASTVDDIRLVVEHARLQGRNLRIRGSGHSPSDLVCVDDGQGWLLDISRLNAFLAVSPDNKAVSAQAGMTIQGLIDHLAGLPQPLALSSLGSIADQTLAGACQTATHGAGLKFGCLSSYLSYLDVVLPQPGAPIVRVSPEEDADLFAAASCGLGACGIVVAVGMQVEPRFRLQEECWTMDWSEFKRNIREVAASAEHVRAYWFPQVGEVRVSRMNRTTLPITPAPSRLYSFVFDTVVGKHVHALGLLMSKFLPSWWLKWHANVMWTLVHDTSSLLQTLRRKIGGRPGTSGVGLSGQGSKRPSETWSKIGPSVFRVDWSERIFNYDCGFPQYTTEICVPVATLSNALEDLTSWIPEAKRMGQHFPIEMRWTRNDSIWLSPTYGDEPACYLGAIQYRPYNVDVPHEKLFKAFEDVLKRHRARPHWAKSHSWTPSELKTLYPRLDDWLAVRNRVDPQKVLVNAYLRRHLDIPSSL